jgi:hypothetical protein
MPLKDYVQYQLETGSPTTVGQTTLTPQSQVLSVRWPNGGWVWNRPVAVLVEQDGESERLPIIDVTRMAQIGLIAFAFFFAVLTLLVRLGTKRRK